MPEAFEALHQQVFVLSVVLLFLLERISRLRQRPDPGPGRWFANFGLMLVSGALARWLMPVSLLALAASLPAGAMQRAGLPLALQALLGFVALDALQYGLHRLMHANALLWRLHRVHHSDTEVDLSTTERHHPLEALLGGGLQAVIIVMLGLPVAAVGTYAVVATLVAWWSHANLRLPPAVDAKLRLLLVTPGSHLLHHSALPAQTNSNYGTVLTLWDRAFGSWRCDPPAEMRSIGLEDFRRPADHGLFALLCQPFVRTSTPPGQPDPGVAAQAESQAAWSAMPLSPAWKRALRNTALGCSLALLVMAPTAVEMAMLWTRIEAYRYAWLVMPMLIYVLGWHRRADVLALVPQPSVVGVAFAVLGAVLWNLAWLMNLDVGRQLALVLVLHGVVWAALGGGLYRHMFPALALLFLMVPCGDLLQPVLRQVTATGLLHSASWLGLPVQMNGHFLTVSGHRYFVAEACSGLAHVTLLAFLGYSFGLLLYRSTIKVLGCALLGSALGVLSNQGRVLTIVYADHLQGTQMSLEAHGHLQWLALATALAGLLLLLACAPSESVEIDTSPGASRGSGRGRFAQAGSPHSALLAGLGVAFVVGPVVGAGQSEAVAPVRAAVPHRLPAEIAGWRLDPFDSTEQSVRDTNETTTRTFIYRREARQLRIDIVQARSIGTKLPADALVPRGPLTWQDIRIDQTPCPDGSCPGFVHTTWRARRDLPLRHVHHAWGIAGFSTTSTLALRAAVGWFRLIGQGRGPHLTVLTIDGEALAPEEAASLQHSLTAADVPI